MGRGRVFTALLLAALAWRAPALADGDVTKARKVFADGVRLYQAGDWEGARRLFREAEAEHHAPAIVYNIALAEEKLGHSQAAVDAYESYVAEAGDNGEFAAAATSAIVQIKAHATRLRVVTNPAGARVFLDGTPLNDATTIIAAGHHVVVAQGDGWRDEQDLEARGGGEQLTITLAAPAPPAPEPVEPPPVVHEEPRSRPVVPPVVIAAPPEHPSDLTWGAGFAFVPAYMLGVTRTGADNARPAVSIVAGPVLEIGYALTERFEFLGRGLAGLGPDGKPSYAYMGGPGLSFNLIPSRLWIGATFIGGELETKAGTPKARYGTDLVFGVLGEINVVVLNKPSGQWMAGFQPAFLLTEMRQDNTTFFFPFTFGYRAY